MDLLILGLVIFNNTEIGLKKLIGYKLKIGIPSIYRIKIIIHLIILQFHLIFIL